MPDVCAACEGSKGDAKGAVMEGNTVIKGQKMLKRGYTTGTCAAAAAKAASAMLFLKEDIREVSLTVPAGVTLFLEVENIVRRKKSVSCAVRKDAGDDPDITDGMLVFAEVRVVEESLNKDQNVTVLIRGGQGVGRVTKKGLEQPVGSAAINRVPRQMITEAVGEIARRHGFQGILEVTVFLPEGEVLAKKTFNPRLGIVGGLSILGTTGIVEPMSEKALTETILLEMKVKRQEDVRTLILVPGNYGSDFLEETLGISTEQAVKCSNYIGEALDMAVALGFQKVLLVGHIGKFVKLAAGIMNTHSHMADARGEIFLAAISHLASKELKDHPQRSERFLRLVPELEESVTTDEMLSICERGGIRKEVMGRIMERISWQLSQRTKEELGTELITFSKEWGILGMTDHAMELVREIERERKGQ